MFDREVALYRKLQEQDISVTFVTYGNASDLNYASRIKGIKIICNRWQLPPKLYVLLLTTLYPMLWKGSSVFKSNQTYGADVAMQASRLFGNKFIARSGYPYADFAVYQYGAHSKEAKKARIFEKKVFTAAHKIVVTTETVKDTIIKHYGMSEDQISVVPNYVDTNLFKPNHTQTVSSKRLCFVGRLEPQKNPMALLEAIQNLNVELIIVGNGMLRHSLEKKTKSCKLPVRFLGNVPHTKLPSILSKCSLFVLPSLYEGHPKALLEAMACGMPVIGYDVPGIRELIHHKINGFLCKPDPASLREAIDTLLNNDNLRESMGYNARRYVEEHSSLDYVLSLEQKIIHQVLQVEKAL